MDIEDIQDFVLEAQRHAPKSPERRRTLEPVFKFLLKSDFFYFPSCPYYLPQKRYPDFCEIALQEFCWDIIRKEIDNYNPERGSFVSWIKSLFILRYKQYLKKEARQIQITSLDELMLKGFDINNEKMSKKDSLTNQIIKYCQEDPEGILKKKYCCQKNCPRANLQILILKRYEGYEWEEIAEEVCSVNNRNTISALSRCYCKSVQQIGVLLKEQF